jgi:hypothetical protein
MVAVALLAAVAAGLGIGVAPMPGERLAVDEPQYWFTALSLAQDGNLDISDELGEQSWRNFATVAPPLETVVLADGSQISPHDPLLPLLLAIPVAAGGWVAAKVALALLAGALAAATVWTAVRRFAVPLPLAAAGVGVAATSAPLAVYGQQLYPELSAALACLLGVAAVTGPPRRPQLALLAAAAVALPWLSVKYTPVAAALAGLAAWRWWRTGQRGDVLSFGAAVAVAGGMYLAAHRAIWGGWTVYASGDQFSDVGEFAVVGADPDYLVRAWRLVGLLVDQDFGLGAWQPAWLLVVPALAALAARPPRGFSALTLPLLAGWLVATFLANTMHGWWWRREHLRGATGQWVGRGDRLGLRLHPRRRPVLPGRAPAAASLPGLPGAPGLGGDASRACRGGRARRVPDHHEGRGEQHQLGQLLSFRARRADQLLDQIGDRRPQVGVDQTAVFGEGVVGLTDGQFLLDHVRADRPQHLAQLGLRPNCAEQAGGGTHDGYRLVPQGIV